MALKVHINYSGEISQLCRKYPSMSFLESSTIPEIGMNQWTLNHAQWGYSDKRIYELQVMFIGKTGYGKSTTLNRIVGQNAFETSDVSVCTKDLYEAIYRISGYKGTFISLCDLPGIGESNYADDQYYVWYRDMLQKSHCVVYIIRADQRDYALDEILFNQMFQDSKEREKVILALNFADKIEPLNRHSMGLTAEQFSHLEAKVKDVEKIFGLPKERILYYSAGNHYNIDLLMEKIADILKRQV